ncbi:hypothetical protein ACU686_00560 [Yinghuangia aomiensis]
MLAAAEAAGADWTLLYGGRTHASMAFVDELAHYGSRVTVAPHDETGPLDLDHAPGRCAVGHAGVLLRSGTAARRCRGGVAARGRQRTERFRRWPPPPAATGRTGLELAVRSSWCWPDPVVQLVPPMRRSWRRSDRPVSRCSYSCAEGTCRVPARPMSWRVFRTIGIPS